MLNLSSHKRAISEIQSNRKGNLDMHRRVQSNLHMVQGLAEIRTFQDTKQVSQEFLGLLDAAETYFTQETNPTILHSELDDLSESLSKECLKSESLLLQIDQKQKEFVSLSKYLEEMKFEQSLLETSLKKLKIYSHTLDLEISRNFRQIHDFSSYLSSVSSRTQQPSPVPIKYKPISSRLVRRRT